MLGIHDATIARDWNMPNGAKVTKFENLVVVGASQREFQTRDHAVPQVDWRISWKTHECMFLRLDSAKRCRKRLSWHNPQICIRQNFCISNKRSRCSAIACQETPRKYSKTLSVWANRAEVTTGCPLEDYRQRSQREKAKTMSCSHVGQTFKNC